MRTLRSGGSCDRTPRSRRLHATARTATVSLVVLRETTQTQGRRLGLAWQCTDATEQAVSIQQFGSETVRTLAERRQSTGSTDSIARVHARVRSHRVRGSGPCGGYPLGCGGAAPPGLPTATHATPTHPGRPKHTRRSERQGHMSLRESRSVSTHLVVGEGSE